jgi:DNA repair protein RadD
VKLRPYQERIIQALRVRYSRGLRRLVLVMATGAGKTAVSREMIRAALERGRRVIFVVDLDEVVDDTARGLQEDGIPCGIIQAGKLYQEGLGCYVCSLQTLTARGLRPPADLVILDECHCFAAALTLELLSAYPEAWHLGLTATPQRGDGTSLGTFYQEIVQGPQVGWLQKHGQCSKCHQEGPAGPCACGAERHSYLVDYVIHAPAAPLKAGRLAWDPVEAWFNFAAGQRALYFCANRKHALELVERFTAAGVPAEAITGSTPRKKRKGVRLRLRERRTLVVCTHSVGIKGWDCRELECVGLWRRVEVTGTFLQMGGRGLRPAPGKRRMVFLDGAGSVHWHGLFDEERSFSLDGDPIRLQRPGPPALATCPRCSAIQRPARICIKCGAAITAQTVSPRASKKNQLRVIKEVPAPQRQERIFDDLVRRGVRIVVPALQAKQQRARERGGGSKNTVGPWLGLRWAVKEVQKRWGFLPSEELIEAMRLKYVEKPDEDLSAQ